MEAADGRDCTAGLDAIKAVDIQIRSDLHRAASELSLDLVQPFPFIELDHLAVRQKVHRRRQVIENELP